MQVEEFRDTINKLYQKYDTMAYLVHRIILPQQAEMELNPKPFVKSVQILLLRV
jgi:hypothetical protein